MKKEGNAQEKKEKEINCSSELELQEDCCCEGSSCDDECCSCNQSEQTNEELDLHKKLQEKSKQCDEYIQMLQRTAAEFDNYKKRTIREKESLYSDAVSDAVKAFLPVIDSIDSALQSCTESTDTSSLQEGIKLIHRQIQETMKKLGVEEIKGVGETFDPELHNAVMHIEDEAFGSNVVAEVFQKGYQTKDKVIRYSMVKVAN